MKVDTSVADVFAIIVDETYRDSMYVVPIILVGYFFLGLYYNLAIWYKVTDKTIYGTLIAGVGTLLTIAVNLILLPKVGVLASAYAAMACYIIMAVLCYLIGRRHLRIPYRIGRFLLVLGLVLLVNFIYQQLAASISWPVAHWAIRFALLALFAGIFWLMERNNVKQWLSYT